MIHFGVRKGSTDGSSPEGSSNEGSSHEVYSTEGSLTLSALHFRHGDKTLGTRLGYILELEWEKG